MKKSLLILSVMFLAVLGASAEAFAPKSQKQSACKKAPEERKETRAVFQYENGELQMDLFDYVTHCGADLTVTLYSFMPGELLFAIEDTSTALASCVCPFDVSSVFEGIPAGDYHVQVLDVRYVDWERTIMESDMLLEEGQSVTMTAMKDPVQVQQSACSHPIEYPVYTQTSITYDAGKLKVDMADVEANCIASLYVMLDDTHPGELRFLICNSEFPAASCVCRYDLTTMFTGIEPGQYKVTVTQQHKPSYCRQWTVSEQVDIVEGESVVLEQPSGVSEVRATDAMLVFGKDMVLVVGFEGPTDIEVYDSAGRLELSLPVIGPSEIDLNWLDKGVHLVRAVKDGRTELLRFVK